MTRVGSVYGQALYDLAQSENLAGQILRQITALDGGFSREPEFLRLLAAPNLSKEERCAVVEGAFGGKVHPYVLNFLKILTEKGYPRHFSDCRKTYQARYNRDHGILPVTAVSAVTLSPEQSGKLTAKLSALTGKTVELTNRVIPEVLGGIRLDYDGKRVDGTVARRLDAVRALLKK